MIKLLKKYDTSRTLAVAIEVKAYDRQHPMASCMLNAYETTLLADAVALAASGFVASHRSVR